MGDASGPRLYHAHVARNRQPILDVLERVLPSASLVLEIASGSGEHAVFFAENLSSLRGSRRTPMTARLRALPPIARPPACQTC
jgi:hypothetical protein